MKPSDLDDMCGQPATGDIPIDDWDTRIQSYERHGLSYSPVVPYREPEPNTQQLTVKTSGMNLKYIMSRIHDIPGVQDVDVSGVGEATKRSTRPKIKRRGFLQEMKSFFSDLLKGGPS